MSGAVLLLAGAASCAKAPEIRDQTVLVIDTDLPLAGAPSAMPVAAMDTLRIDVLEGATVVESRDFVLADPRDWPLSIGVASRARLHVRLFQARVDRPELSVERLVDVAAPSDGAGVRRVRVLLTGDCIGRTVDPATRASCADGAHLEAPPDASILVDDGGATRAGTWPHVQLVPCSTADDPARPCVPGGFDVVGDVSLAATPTRREQPLPLRPVVMSPFRMDRTEVTVGRYRALARAGRLAGAPVPGLADPRSLTRAQCTFRGDDEDGADRLPLNCATPELARAVCRASGGALPTEAQWEHAARRGDGRAHPWGDEAPACCTTSASRSPFESIPAECPRGPVEPVGSHVASTSRCPGGGDVSPDGVVDLGGSLAELTRDRFLPVADCFASGLLFDPVCATTASRSFVRKGTDWTAGLARTRAAYRGEAHADGMGETTGFRCVYPEPTP